MTQAYPLHWPTGWKREAKQKAGRFKKGNTGNTQLTVADACGRVVDELERMGVSYESIIISTNIQPRLDNRPRSGQKEPEDVGVAVYWTDKGNQRCIAIDIYNRVADNLAAIAATLDAMRAIERHGGAEILNRAFAGFVALPAPGQQATKTWWEMLDISEHATPEEIKAARRRFAREHHPDKGGDSVLMAELNKALSDAGIEL